MTERLGNATQVDVREVGDGEKGVLVEDFAVKEPLQEVPRHWSFAGGRRLSADGCYSILDVGIGMRKEPSNAQVVAVRLERSEAIESGAEKE